MLVGPVLYHPNHMQIPQTQFSEANSLVHINFLVLVVRFFSIVT